MRLCGINALIYIRSEKTQMSDKKPAKMGRPQFVIDWKVVESMCGIYCTGEEIAGVLGCSYDTLERAIKREYSLTFAEFFEQKAAKGKVSLRRKQFDSALSGDRTMLIWLGKQWLGQQDKQATENKSDIKITWGDDK
mgnify:FL=1